MSVFLNNDCKYPNCGKVFVTLRDLIIHIENVHIDFDPLKIEQIENEKPDCLPLSYILKYDYSGDEGATPNEVVPAPSTSNVSVIENQVDCVKYGCDYKNKKIVNDNERIRLANTNFKSKFVSDKLYYFDEGHKKPFICCFPGCNKRYKNVNGVKYHYKNFHRVGIAANPLKKPKMPKSMYEHIGHRYTPQPYVHYHNDPLNATVSRISSMNLNEDGGDDMLPADIYDYVNVLSTSNDLNQVPLSQTSFSSTSNSSFDMGLLNGGYDVSALPFSSAFNQN